MTTVEELVCLPQEGWTLGQLGQHSCEACPKQCLMSDSLADELIQEQSFRGFPLVRSYEDLSLLGYITRGQLRAAISQCFK